MKPKKDPMVGRVFGKLTVIARSSGGEHSVYLCCCACGNETTVYGFMLRTDRTQSCGCKQRSSAAAAQDRRWAKAKAPPEQVATN